MWVGNCLRGCYVSSTFLNQFVFICNPTEKSDTDNQKMQDIRTITGLPNFQRIILEMLIVLYSDPNAKQMRFCLPFISLIFMI